MTELIKIQLGGKYAIIFDRPLTMAEAARIRRDWDELIASDKTELFILDSTVKLININPPDEK